MKATFLREPLLHFLFLGAALFVAYALLNPGARARPDEVVVSSGEIEHLATRFTVFSQRPPTSAELKGLIDEYVREEILSREAVKFGLDRDDTIIRSRLQQKMELIADDMAAVVEPNDADLAGYLARHPDAFRSEPRLSFRQVYLDPARHRGRPDADAARLLARLRAAGTGVDLGALGDPFLLPAVFTDAPGSTVRSQFGPEFAKRVAALPHGEWAGPLRSGYGLHLVLLTARSEGRVPQLSQVRASVRREWSHERRLEAKDRFYQEVLRHYRVSIDWPRQASRSDVPREAHR